MMREREPSLEPDDQPQELAYAVLGAIVIFVVFATCAIALYCWIFPP